MQLCSKEEQTKNPEVIINALQTYERQLRDNNVKHMHGAESLDDLSSVGTHSLTGSTSSAPSSPHDHSQYAFDDHAKVDTVTKGVSDVQVSDRKPAAEQGGVAKQPPTPPPKSDSKPLRKKPNKKKWTDAEIMEALGRCPWPLTLFDLI